MSAVRASMRPEDGTEMGSSDISFLVGKCKRKKVLSKNWSSKRFLLHYFFLSNLTQPKK